MKLSKKTLVYSCILAVIMVLFIIGYFMLMLPSLYVSYMEESNYEEIVAAHKNYMENGSYDNVTVKNSMNMFTIEISDKENEIKMVNSYLSLSVVIKDEELKNIIFALKEELENCNDDTTTIGENKLEEYFKQMKDKLIFEDFFPEDYPMEIKLFLNKGSDWKEESARVVNVSDNQVVLETSVTDGNNYYTTYFVIGKSRESLVISILSVVTPRMREIRPIILQSLPMIIAVIFFLMLILSQIFSNRIVVPIINLANYARKLNLTENEKAEPFKSDRGSKNRTGQSTKKNKINRRCEKDEITELGETLYELYEKLYSSYALLEEKNQELREDNKRQEVFLRASSHQLKTPIAAALLLVEGMIDEIGKYKNTKETLPKVKEQILSMKKIVEDILYLNHSLNGLQLSDVSVDLVMDEIISAYQVHVQNKKIKINIKGEPFLVWTNSDILEKIIDNLMSNAVNHTIQNGNIDITYEKSRLIIRNQGDNIPDTILPHIFEPFVSSDTRQKGKGLGLYVVSWYGKMLDIKVEIKNVADGVQVFLEFPADNIHMNFTGNSYESGTIDAAGERK